MEKVFVIDPDGRIHGLWDDTIDFREVGECRVERASSVEFNNDTKKWDIHLADGTYIGSEDSRAMAIQWEVEYLQERL
jgi:hypothetical protein